MTQSAYSRLDYIPLSAIHYNPAINARRDTETDVSELAATIDAQNLGQPLLLRPAGRDRYEPVDGGRRLRALKLLAEQGKVSLDHPIPAYIRELDDKEAMSLSLATVITRVDLHPADEALDFTDLVQQGMKPEEIAVRFGIPLRRVRQRLAIGRLPEEIVAALKAGKIGLADAQAFTLLHDSAHALKLFRQGVKEEWAIRREFSKKRIPAETSEAAYVGRDAYAAAGGAIDEDLFSNNVWFADGKLLSKLFQQKLKDDEKAWLAEGWSFVVIDIDPNTRKTSSWPNLQPEGKPNLTKEQTERADELKAEIKLLRRKVQEADDNESFEEAEQQLQAAEDELEDLTAKHFTAAQKAKSGVVVRRGYDNIRVEFGAMKPAAAKKEAKASKQKARDTSEDPSPVRSIEPDAEADFTQALAVEMARVMTDAMQQAISKQPSKAHRLAASVLMIMASFSRAEGFAIEAPRKDRAVQGPLCFDAVREVVDEADSATARVFTAAEQHPDLDRLVAMSLARLFALDPQSMQELRAIIDAFDPDVTGLWLPDADFYKRMPRESLAAALAEAAIAGVTPSKKKKELVEIAVRELTPKGWLPKPLRTPSYKGPGSNAWAVAAGAAAAGKEEAA